jgi:hypothetical protein
MEARRSNVVTASGTFVVIFATCRIGARVIPETRGNFR